MLERTGWTATGYYWQDGKEVAVPIGVYKDYETARTMANAWSKTAPPHNGDKGSRRWSLEPTYKEYEGDE